LRPIAAAALALLSGSVAAQVVSCAISATPMAFGVYDPTSPSPLGPVTSTIDVGCSVPPGSGNVTGFPVNLSLSRGASPTYAPRHMTGVRTGGTVEYNVFTSASASQIWGDGSGGSVQVPVTIPKMTPGQAGRVSVVAYGFVRQRQLNADADDYVDTIVVIANW